MKRIKSVWAALFVVFLAVVGLSRAVMAQSFTDFATPAPHYQTPFAIAAGPDGAMWFTQMDYPTSIGRISMTGQTSEFVVNPNEVNLFAITAGPDNALWFVNLDGSIGRLSTTGAVSTFTVGNSDSGLHNIITGPDGALWFTETGPDPSKLSPQVSAIGNIGRITTDGAVTVFPVGIAYSQPLDITAGPDGNLWFTEAGCYDCKTVVPSKIGRITTAGVVTEFALPAGHYAGKIVAGPDGAFWFSDFSNTTSSSLVGRITTTGALTEFPVNVSVSDIVKGADGALWLDASPPAGSVSAPGYIVRLTTSGQETDFPIPGNGNATQIAEGPDGAVWFTQADDEIGRLGVTPTGPIVASILPSSRSISLSSTATGFATMINAGSTPATNCQVTLAGFFVGYSYQTTDRATNLPTGVPNTPVTIPPGGVQTFVFNLKGSAIGFALAPVDDPFQFSCDNGAAAIILGVNTLLLSVSTTQPPDVIALVATTTGDGILHIAGSGGAGAFAVATANVGTSDTITVKPDTGSATLPLTLTICQTNPLTAACLQPPAASVTTTINANDIPTFSIFAGAGAAIPFSPGASRIFVRFSDSTGAVRGATSVAVETQ